VRLLGRYQNSRPLALKIASTTRPSTLWHCAILARQAGTRERDGFVMLSFGIEERTRGGGISLT